MYGVVDKDYIIEDGNIRFINTEFSNYNNIITFIVFKSTIDNNVIELRPITEEELNKLCV